MGVERVLKAAGVAAVLAAAIACAAAPRERPLPLGRVEGGAGNARGSAQVS